jgi:hypothetical protein
MGRPETQRSILIETLAMAVPLWIDRLAGELAGRRSEQMISWASDAADAVASHGDVLLYGGKRGEAAVVFNAMARGLAALAFCPGGVTFLGIRWCARHHPTGTSPGPGRRCYGCDREEFGESPCAFAHPRLMIRDAEDAILKEEL